MFSSQETLILVLLVIVVVLLGASGFLALLRERYRRGRDDDRPDRP